MYPHTDQPLRDMPIQTKEEAAAFVVEYRKWLYANAWTGNGAFVGARDKPATIRAPDLVQKAHLAYEIAEMNYWQMPFEKAKRMHYGLPLAKWQAERTKRGLDANP